MRKLWLVGSFAALVVTTVVVFATTREASAAPLNETNAVDEADFCSLHFPATASAEPGEPVIVTGRIFEDAVTNGPPGENPFLTGEVGLGPIGSNPLTDPGWQYYPASYNGDFSNDDEYVGELTAPGNPSATQYAYTVRFSLQSSPDDHTYCDLDGAGSNTGLDFSAAQLGTLSVSGTDAGGDADGDVTTSVDVIADPGACIILSTSVVNYGALTFSTQNTAQSGNSGVTITSCSLTTSLDLLAKGTDASGPSASWALTLPPNSNNMCDTGNSGVDEFSQRARGVALTLTNQLIANGLAQGSELFTDLALGMPCIGSSGTGETVSSSVTFTAIPGAAFVDADLDGFAPPEDCDDNDENVNPAAPEIIDDGVDNDCDGQVDEGGNLCAQDIQFITTGTTSEDNTQCVSPPSEVSASCFPQPSADHKQYFALEIQSSEAATITVTAPSWDAAVALYELDPQDFSAVEVECADLVTTGDEVIAHQNTNPTTRTYILQVEGAAPGNFGPYSLNLDLDVP